MSKLRDCGVIFVGKANMHEMGCGTTGNNPNHGQVFLTFSSLRNGRDTMNSMYICIILYFSVSDE